MTDDLVKRWDDYVESMGSVMGDVEHMAQQMRDRIEALTADFALQVQRTDEQREAYEQDLSVMEADNARLREALEISPPDKPQMTEAEFRAVMGILWKLSTVTRTTTPEGHDDE